MKFLYNPHEFFEGRKESMIPALTILAIYGVIGAVIAYQTTTLLIPKLPVEVRQYMGVGVIVGTTTAFIMPYITWIVLGAIFYGITALFDGKGSFKELLAMIGYGFVPLIISSAITGYLSIEAISSIYTITLQDFGKQLGYASIVSIIFTIWSANIFIFAVAHAREVKIRHAAISVLIPVGLWIAYTALRVM